MIFHHQGDEDDETIPHFLVLLLGVLEELVTSFSLE